MDAHIKKTTTKSTGRSASSVAGKSSVEVAGTKAVGVSQREAPVQLDEARLEHLIRERAYFIWEAKGRKHGHDVEIWHQAKKEVLAQLKKSF